MIDSELGNRKLESPYTSGNLATFFEVSPSEVDSWVRAKLIIPSVRVASGQGTRRLFGAEDLHRAALVCRLRKSRPSWKPKQILPVLEYYKRILDDPNYLNAQLLIHQDNLSLILCREHGREPILLDAKSPDQLVMVIALDTLLDDTKRWIANNK